MLHLLSTVAAVLAVVLSGVGTLQAQQPQALLSVLDKSGAPTLRIVDGNSIKLRAQFSTAVNEQTAAEFVLDGRGVVANCVMAKGATNCTTSLVDTLGWHWDANSQAHKTRTLQVQFSPAYAQAGATLDLQITPRPAVLVHGFASSAETWSAYTSANGFLAAHNIRGFAVGDGQATGVLNTGSIANPTGATNTIAQNAAILHDYIEQVKKITGADYVDLISHSMGGLISRYYIDRLMSPRDVAQLVMLGPPNDGTDCANLPASLNLYLPASLEIRPIYVREIFNRQIIRRQGVPFSVVAGTQLIDPIAAPCTDVPTDMAIALSSASKIPASLSRIQLLHNDLHKSSDVFDRLVLPLLRRVDFPVESDPPLSDAATPPLDFTRIFTGHVSASSSQEVKIQIDNVSVANFALYDTTRSLTITVRGASGNVITLDPTRNGLISVTDPSTLLYLGYGFINPRAGVWTVNLQSTERTPSQGADFAITAQMRGGANLRAATSKLLPAINEEIEISARLELGNTALAMRDAHAHVRQPNGTTETIALTPVGNDWNAKWKPSLSGLHSIDLQVNGALADGTSLERVSFLSVDVQPSTAEIRSTRDLVLMIVTVCAALIVSIAWVLIRKRAMRKK